MYKLP